MSLGDSIQLGHNKSGEARRPNNQAHSHDFFPLKNKIKLEVESPTGLTTTTFGD